jgi:hypothetical protein
MIPVDWPRLTPLQTWAALKAAPTLVAGPWATHEHVFGCDCGSYPPGSPFRGEWSYRPALNGAEACVAFDDAMRARVDADLRANGWVLVDDTQDGARDPASSASKDMESLTELTLIRADLLDLLKACDIAPHGIMSFADDLVAVKRYVEDLRATDRVHASARAGEAARITEALAKQTRRSDELRVRVAALTTVLVLAKPLVERTMLAEQPLGGNWTLLFQAIDRALSATDASEDRRE